MTPLIWAPIALLIFISLIALVSLLLFGVACQEVERLKKENQSLASYKAIRFAPDSQKRQGGALIVPANEMIH